MSASSLALAGCLLLIVGVHVFWFTPKIEALGRILTSAEASGGAPAVQGEFGRYHGAYVVTDMLKACILFAAVWISPGAGPLQASRRGGENAASIFFLSAARDYPQGG